MPSRYRIMFGATLAMLALMCYAATRSNADDDRTTSHAVTVDTNGDDTASIPDFDGDGTIGFGDFLIFAGVFGAREGDEKYKANYDLNGDGEIGFSDFVIFAQNFGKDAPSPVVTIPDANLRAVIEAALDKATGAPITQIEMRTLTRLVASFAGVSDLTGLEFAISLTHLNFWDNRITDLSPLSGLTKLTSLILSYNGFNITDISPLAGLANLTELGLFYTNVSDISPLASLTNLTSLSLGSEDIMVTDISPLAGLTKLNFLFLARNAITDISPLAGLDNLKYLNLWRNKIKDISPLASLASLTELHLGNNPILDISLLSGMSNLAKLHLDDLNITDITLLGGLTNLTELGLSNNAITDISALASLSDLIVLRLSNNAITDISALAGLTDLIVLRLSNNAITDISALAGLTDLTELRLDNNNVTDISVLTGLTSLTTLVLGYNSITDVSALEGLTSLIELSLRFNVISDISALSGLTNLKWLWLEGNLLNDSSINDHISVLQNSGTEVKFDPPRPKGDFDIELVFLDSFTEKQKNVLRYVARRWMAVISEDLPDYEFTQGWTGRCGDRSYEIPAGERINDLRIYMTTFDVDDNPNAVGWGGPSLLREESHLPVLGCMAFNLERANLLITGLHEIGHVLGFGTVWDDLGFLQDLDGDTHFNGPLAIVAFNDAGGRDYSGAKVPVQKMGGGHWRRPVLNGELMGPGGGGALSAITVQSLADLGFGVDVSQADPYTLPGATASKSAAKTTSYHPLDPGPVLDVTRATISPSRNADLYGQGRVADGRSFIYPDRRWTGRQESAEWVWGRGIESDVTDDRKLWNAGPPAYAEPELTCGAALINEPIYVVDPQGRVVRTIGQ